MAAEPELSPAELQGYLDREVAEALAKGGWLLFALGLAGGLGVAVTLLTGAGADLLGPLVFALAAGAYSLAVALLARSGRMRGAVLYAVLLPFFCLPTWFFLLSQATQPAGAATYITGPISYLYLVLIVASGFTYRPGLSLLTGLLAAAGYGLVYWLARPELAAVRSADPTLQQDLSAVPIYAIKCGMMVFAGLVTAALTYRAKRLIVRTLAEQRQKDRLGRLFGQYVSDEVKDRLLAESRELQGERKRVVVLFSDIRGFSTLSEQLEPEQIVERLNEYFDAMVEAIRAQGGVVDKFIGDAVMAVFGGLLELPDPAAAAVRAARAMRRRLAALNQAWAGRGLAAFDNGVGLHLGPVLQGPIGSAERKEFTVIGDAVNTASRLEGLTKDYPQKIVLSAALQQALPPELQAEARPLGQVRVKGKQTAVDIYGLDDDRPGRLIGETT